MRVSIIMPVYNAEDFIKESIESILNQDYKDFELIIINDGSSDMTHQCIKPYINDKRLQYYDVGRVGKIKAFNIGYEKSASDFVCFFHGDDVMTEKGISARLEPLLESNKKLVACAAKLKTISSNKKYDSILIPKSAKGSLSGQAVMYKKELSDMIFPIPENLPNEDVWMRLHIKYFADELIDVLDVIAKYRIHDSNSFLSIGALNDFKDRSEKVHIRRKYVLESFIKKYRDILNSKDVNKIKNYIDAEEYRYAGKWIRIIFSKITFKNKIKFIFESNKYFYKIKIKLSSLLMGRG